MRIKANFSVFPRKLASGRRVYYYQCYDGRDRRQWAKSTGKDKKTEAVRYCENLFKDGLLIPKLKIPTFGEFSEGWWDLNTCQYLKWRQLHDPIEDSTILMYKGYFKNHIKEHFAKFGLDEITPKMIESWLVLMSEKKHMSKKVKDKNLSPLTINHTLKILKIMFGEAVRLKLLEINPCSEIKELKRNDVDREIFTVEEVKKLFSPNWAELWSNETVYIMNRLAACTGMRMGEIRGLMGKYVFDDYVFVCGQYTPTGYKSNTKTKHNRNIPITPLMRKELEGLLQTNGDGYVFSDDKGAKPMSVDRIRRQFDNALKKSA